MASMCWMYGLKLTIKGTQLLAGRCSARKTRASGEGKREGRVRCKEVKKGATKEKKTVRFSEEDSRSKYAEAVAKERSEENRTKTTR